MANLADNHIINMQKGSAFDRINACLTNLNLNIEPKRGRVGNTENKKQSIFVSVNK